MHLHFRSNWIIPGLLLALTLVLSLPAPAQAAKSVTDCDGLARHECEILAWREPITFTPLMAISPLPYAYARVVRQNAPVYQHPADTTFGFGPKRTLGVGLVYVSVTGQALYRGVSYYQINPGEYVAATDLSFVTPSTLSGRYFDSPPAAPFGWVIAGDRLRTIPSGPLDTGLPTIGRYQLVTISNLQRVGEWNWYEVGPGQWIEQRHVAQVTPQPAANGLSGQWIEVNLYEQTAVAFEDGRLVYATLTSSGLQAWSTPTGLYRVWAKQNAGRMTGAYRSDKSDYYFLEDVPWILYFEGDVSLHGAYWHDGFGYRRSHGCVNLAPADARWFFNWASVGTPVYVYTSAPAN